jgi:hypothetical protein
MADKMLRKNVSISYAPLRLLDPLLKKHLGNPSATMRDIIDFTGFITENMGKLERAKDLLKQKNHAKQQTHIYDITIPLTMFQWQMELSRLNWPVKVTVNREDGHMAFQKP